MPLQQEIADHVTGRWKTELFQAPCENPLQCLFGCVCLPCAAYTQRKELLELTGEPYVCCAGLCPCGPLGQPQDENCLFLEACCCCGWALSGNRFMVQTRFDKQNTPCDDCILWTTCIISITVDIARCFCDVPDELRLLADCLVISVNGCMHAQQDIEIKDIKMNGYKGPPQHIVGLLSPTQQSMVQMGKPAGGGGAPGTQMFGAPMYAGAAAAGAAGAGAAAYGMGGQPQKQQEQHQHMAPQQMQQMQMQQMQMQQMQQMQQQQPGSVQVCCGGCGKIFGSPSTGVTVACPHCGTHNQVGGAPQNQQMYGGFGGMQQQQQQQQQRPGGGGMMMAAGAVGLGALGGFMAADMASEAF